jgi:hypothetical protein
MLEADSTKNSNKRNERKFKGYMSEVGSYMDKVRAGRSIRKVDLNQEAFSDEAETLRQTKMLDRANAYDKLMRSR